MRWLLTMVLLLALSTFPLAAADIVFCKKAYQAREIVANTGTAVVMTPTEWAAVPQVVREYLATTSRTRAVYLGIDPTPTTVRDAIDVAIAGEYECIVLRDTTRDAACTSRDDAIALIGDPICETLLGFPNTQINVNRARTRATATCEAPNTNIKIIAICDPTE